MGIGGATSLSPREHALLLELLDAHLPGAEAWLYGSRARGSARPESDLDMVVFANADQALEVAALREAFDESDLPFRVDLFVWDEIPPEFQEEIARAHQVLVKGARGG